MLKKIHLIIYNSDIYHKMHLFGIRLKMMFYQQRMPKIAMKIQKKRQINVLFFAVSVSMWKYDRLFQLLMQDPKYKPYIVSFIYPHEVPAERAKKQEQMQDYFIRKGFSFYKSYDPLTETWLTDMNNIPTPDVVIYSQPYNTGNKAFRIERFWKNALFVYAPYCMMIEKSEDLYNTLLLNIAYIVFCNSQYEKELLTTMMFNKGKNLFVSGYLPFDDIRNAHDSGSLWHSKQHEKIRIIWAPHHSIRPQDLLSYGTFLSIAKSMQEIAELHQNEIEWVFKPHPMLRSKLYQHPAWGKTQTDEYYAWWEKQTYSSLQEGDYAELFISSDAMIHDCSSFMCEYLLTEKPVLYLTKKQIPAILNSFGEECLKYHYKALNIQDIENFIQDVVCNKNDVLKQKRTSFINRNFMFIKDKTVAEIMKKEMDSIFFN